MDSVILDHYTQHPFNKTCHQRYPSRPYQSDTTIESYVGALPEETLPPHTSSLPGQSLLTWSPSQVLMTSPLVNWTPYMATMATNPTAKYSLDIQLSCTRMDSGFEDITTPLSFEDHETTTPSKQLEGTTMSPAEFEDASISHKVADMLLHQDRERNPPAAEPRRSLALSPTESERSSTSSSLAGTRPRRAKRVPAVGSKPATPKTSRPSSRSDHGSRVRSNPNIDGTIRSTSSSSSAKIPTHRSSNRNIDAPSRRTGPSSSRRPSNLSTRRTASRTESFILGRNEPRPIDFAGIVQRTREQQASNPDKNSPFQSPKSLEDEAQSPSPIPAPAPDYPIDWTGPASRAAQYAEIDRKNRGATGLWRRLKRKLKLGERNGDFYDGGSDTGSVRRYRLDTDCRKDIR